VRFRVCLRTVTPDTAIVAIETFRLIGPKAMYALSVKDDCMIM
jgi:hypothetical protein